MRLIGSTIPKSQHFSGVHSRLVNWSVYIVGIINYQNYSLFDFKIIIQKIDQLRKTYLDNSVIDLKK